MIPADHPAREYVPYLRDLAEGRISCDAWLAWWHDHEEELRSALLPGWFSRLKPGRLPRSSNESLAAAIAGASYILTALGVACQPDDHFAAAAHEELQAAVAAIQQRNQEQRRAFQPAIDAIGAVYPKFGRLLARRSDLIVELQPGATGEELQALEQSLGLPLPDKLKTLLLASRHIQLEGFHLGNVFFHQRRGDRPGLSDGMLCFADYFLEADGDQMLIDPRDVPADDPPVHYYAHEIPEVRPLRKSFSAWLESLGRSPLFRE
jgi:hypothetical protein